ncbi:MAG: nucleotidyl transferase AbiEii/AbiGii toxin family protein [Treponema sp.]|nr:nucleotidyl transferase AbiEii/AbiGii toxin family protein [Treponema sp.]
MKTDNAMQLKSKINNKAKSLNISPQFVLQNYIMECFIKRISISEYKNNFILKGGLLIASLVGIQNRSTMDMDTTITGFTLEKEETIKILKQICSISCNDDFNFIFDRIEDIREDDEYSGLRAFLFADYEKIHAPFSIDITTGDKITPKEINYSFKRIFDKDVIEIYSYPIETVIAEKLETILSRNIENTRPRDFYDILALMPLTHNCNSEILREALFNTSKRRSSEKYLKNTKVLVETIKVDTFMNSLWQKYAKKQPYAENITFEKVCSTVENLLDKIGLLN